MCDIVNSQGLASELDNRRKENTYTTPSANRFEAVTYTMSLSYHVPVACLVLCYLCTTQTQQGLGRGVAGKHWVVLGLCSSNFFLVFRERSSGNISIIQFILSWLPADRIPCKIRTLNQREIEAGPCHEEPVVVLPMSPSLTPREACHCGLCPDATGKMALRSCGCDRGTCEWCLVQRCEPWDSRDGCHCEPCAMCQNEATQTICDVNCSCQGLWRSFSSGGGSCRNHGVCVGEESHQQIITCPRPDVRYCSQNALHHSRNIAHHSTHGSYCLDVSRCPLDDGCSRCIGNLLLDSEYSECHERRRTHTKGHGTRRIIDLLSRGQRNERQYERVESRERRHSEVRRRGSRHEAECSHTRVRRVRFSR
ncbi:hypothetical protein EDB81DRAFT_41574 [Dactylonectria macrodidyma]|uniref:Uncharacterized protein n=1 Tax=Dactylonectria macrodidyma TaxID=307937 RepID=A0A9P9JJC8_9HYPO|nr:hypothetical protein EDB81DRAFT_41574 [Dactylonectria macrodidyma]